MADDARVQVTIAGRQVGVVEAASETRIALAALEAQSAELSAKMRTFGADALAAVRGGESISSLVPRFVELDATIAATRAQMAALKAEAAAPIPFLARSDYKPPTQAIHYATANPATLAAVTRELEQQTTVTRQLGAAASEYDAISAAQLQTRLATLRSESVAMRRNYTDEEKANRERLKFAETVAPQSSVAARRALDKDLFDAETANYARLAATQRAATAEMIANLRQYSTEKERAARQSLDFLSKTPALTGAMPVRFAGSSEAGDLRVVAAGVEEIGRKSQQARSLFSGFATNSGRETRELGAVIDEIVSGNFRRLAASLVVMANYSGVLGSVIRGAFSPLGAVIGVAATALGVVAYEAEQAYQRFESISRAAGTLGLRGLGDQSEAVAAQFTRLQSATDEYAGTVRKMQTAISDLVPAARGIGETLADQASAIAGLTKQDPAKVLDELTKAANRSPVALAQVRVAMLGLQDATNSAGQGIIDQVRSAGSLTDQYQVAAHAGEDLRRTELKAGEEAKRAQSDFWLNALALSGMADGAGFASEGANQLATQLDIATNPAHALKKAIDDLTQSERDQIEAVQAGNAVFDKRVSVMQEWVNAQTAAGRGVPGGATAAAELGAQARATRSDPAEVRRHSLNMENIQAEAEARRGSLEAQADAARRREDETRRTETQRFVTMGVDPETAAHLAEGQESVIKAHHATEEADRRVADQSVEIAKVAIQAKVAAEAQGSAEIVALRKQTLEADQRQAAAGRGSPVTVAQDKVQLEAAERAHRDELYRTTVQGLDAEEARYRENAARVAEIEAEKYRAVLAHAEESVRAGAVGPLAPAQVRSEALQRPDVAQQQVRLNEANDRAAKQAIDIEIEKNRAIAADDRRGGQERVQAQIANLRIMEANERLVGRPAIESQKATIATAERQAQDQTFQDERENTRIAVGDAKEHANAVGEIIAAYDRLRASATATGQLPKVQSSINRDEIAALKQEQADLFREAERGATAQERVDAARIASFRASQRAEVASHGESKAQEATNEQQFTASVMAGEEQRTEAMLQNTNLTRDQKDQLYQHLAELYAKDAEQQQQAEERITAAIEAENAKRIALFTNMFDTVGSSLEKLGTAELTGNLAARGSALRSLGTSLVSSGIHAVGSLASDWAGKEIGPSLGLSQEQSKGGLGEVLGNVVAKQLGLLKETPKTDQQKAAELFQKAADAQDKAAGTFGKSVETFADASKRIADAMAKLTPSAAHGGPSASEAPLPTAGATYQETAKLAAAKYGVPQDMFLHQIAGESGFNPNAVSSAGAKGIAQFMPGTAKDYGVDVNDPTSSLYGSAHYMADLKAKTGGWAPAMQAYVAGQGPGADSRFQHAISGNPQYETAYGMAQKADAAPPLAGGSADAAGEIQHKISTQQSGGPTSAMGPYGPMSVPAPATAPQMSMAAGTPQPVDFGVTIGDSIAAGMIRHGAPGTEVPMGTAGGTAAVGRTPEQVLANIKSLPPEKIAGQDVLLSTGLSNAPDQFSQVSEQIAALKADQAKSITMLGVGPKFDQLGLNEKLRGVAGSPGNENVAFAGPLSGRFMPDQIHPAPTSGVSGYTSNYEQAQKAANDQLSTSVRSLDTTTRNATAVGQQGVTATTATTAQGQQTATALGADKTANDALRGATTESKTAQDGLTSATKSQQTAVEQNTTALKQPPKAAATTATGTSASATAGVPTNALTGANDNAGGSSNWALLTQGLGVASGALALFGSNLSTGAREVLGGVAVITQLTSFTKNLNQTFDLFGTATKTASTATTLSGAATTTNAADFALNSVAVQTNATAQTTAAATSAASGAAKGLFGLGILGLAEGGVVYAADGWPSRGTDTVPAMLTPGETVLSVAQTRAMASNANFASASVGGVHPNFQTLTPPPAAANHNAASTFNYSPQISGRFGSMSRGEVNNILRSHGDAFTGMARNFVRNNGGLYGR